MPDERTSPEARILINGVELSPDVRADVLHVSVTQYVEGGDSFDIAVNNLNSVDQRLKWVDANLFAAGNAVDVQLGYRGQLASLIVGEITGLRAEFPSDQAAVLVVQGFDRLHRLRRGRRVRAFHQTKDSQIAEQIARDLGLSAQVEDTGVVHDYVLQPNLSDVDFLLERARRIWYEVLVRDQQLVFRRAANQAAEVVTLEYMKDLKMFRARLSSGQQVSEVAVRGWDPANKAAIVGIGRAGDETTRMGGQRVGPAIAEQAFGSTHAAIVDVPVESQAEADQIAKAKFNDMALSWVTAEGEAVGNTQLRAGTTVRLRGLGNRFSGIYYVRKAEHRLGPELGYVTKFDCIRNAS